MPLEQTRRLKFQPTFGFPKARNQRQAGRCCSSSAAWMLTGQTTPTGRTRTSRQASLSSASKYQAQATHLQRQTTPSLQIANGVAFSTGFLPTSSSTASTTRKLSPEVSAREATTPSASLTPTPIGSSHQSAKAGGAIVCLSRSGFER